MRVFAFGRNRLRGLLFFRMIGGPPGRDCLSVNLYERITRTLFGLRARADSSNVSCISLTLFSYQKIIREDERREGALLCFWSAILPNRSLHLWSAHESGCGYQIIEMFVVFHLNQQREIDVKGISDARVCVKVTE